MGTENVRVSMGNTWGLLPIAPLVLLIAEPVRVLLLWIVLRICGNSRAKAAEWALKRAERGSLRRDPPSSGE